MGHKVFAMLLHGVFNIEEEDRSGLGKAVCIFVDLLRCPGCLAASTTASFNSDHIDRGNPQLFIQQP